MVRMKKTRKSKGPNSAVRAEEIMKCGTDVSYFLSRYVKIFHPTKGLVKFETYPFQNDCLQAFDDHRFVIVNKSRQLGLSTSVAGYSLWMAIFQQGKEILVVATKLDVAKNFIKKVRDMYDHLPSWLVMPTVTEDSKHYLGFSNGSKIKASSTSGDAGRSEALSLLVVDEAAHIEGIEEMWLGIFPTLATGGQAIFFSSPSGVGTLFHKMWIDANDGKNDFYPIELPWTVHPERDEKWFREQRKGIIAAKGERGVAQELLCSFAASGDTFLKGDALDALHKAIKKPIDYIVHGRYETWVWKRPEGSHKYILCADVARGDGDDFSAFHVINTSTDEIVADYKGKPPPDRFAEIMIEIATSYNNALICQELNNVGVAAAIKLKDSGYKNLYYQKFMKNIYMSYVTQDIGDELPGFTTTANSREQILSRLENTLRNKKIKVYSKRLYEELQTFIWKGNKPQAQKGYNDDMVISLAIGCNLYESSGVAYGDGANEWAMLQGISRDVKNFDRSNPAGPTQDPGQTSDGFFSTPQDPNQGADARSQIEKARVKSLWGQKKTHDYNDPYWRTFDWMFDD